MTKADENTTSSANFIAINPNENMILVDKHILLNTLNRPNSIKNGRKNNPN